MSTPVATRHRAVNDICRHDTGSMYGNEPACSRPATATVTVTVVGMGTSYDTRRCATHARTLRASAWPDPVEIKEDR